MAAESGAGGDGERSGGSVFSGNGSSLPPRLPGLSQVLKSLDTSSRVENPVLYTIVALSYRGFWTSRGRPSERGIKLDAAATLAWAAACHPNSKVVLWGQSLGAGVAVHAAAAGLKLEDNHIVLYSKNQIKTAKIMGLILDTPFTSRYLTPFLWSYWDSTRALSKIAKSDAKPKVLILPPGDDEFVPRAHGIELEGICVNSELDVERTVVKGALHHEVLAKPQGRAAVVNFLRRAAERG